MSFLNSPPSLPNLPEWTPPSMPQISSGDYTPGALSHGGQAILTALLACDAELVRHEVELHEFVATVKALDDELAEALEASCS